MARCPFAEWRPVSNFNKGGMTVLGMAPHVIVGSLRGAEATFLNTDPHQKGGRRSAHFGVGKDGRLHQYVDTSDKAWAQAAGNPFYISAECEGLATEAHTPAQVETLARLYAWLHKVHGCPLVVTDTPGQRGVISHRCGGKAWGGHSCPGDLRHAQRQEIVNRARALLESHPSPAKDVKPMYDPPLTDIVASKRCPTGGSWLLKKDGAIFAIDGAPYAGGANGKPYFAGRTAADFDDLTDADRAAGKLYVLLSTQAGGRYAYPE